MTVELKEIYKSFGEKKVLAGLSHAFACGVNTVVGPSGCGKTTLLRIIAGLEIPDSGELLFDGKKRAEPVSFVFSEPRLFKGLSALDNAAVASSSGMKAGRKKAEGYLSVLGLSDALKITPDGLSAGMAQRVQIARALVSLSEGRKLLLLDEPFRGLDPAAKANAAKLILNEAAGKTVICVTHEKDDIPLLKPVSGFSFYSDTNV